MSLLGHLLGVNLIVPLSPRPNPSINEFFVSVVGD